MAPDFGLVDQFGQRHRLSDFRGKVVLLTFIDSDCTTICPITGALLRRTQDLLGQEASGMQLLAVNVNPQHTRVKDVLDWSRDHEMTHRWLFLTGPVSQLRPVWQSYGIDIKMVHGDVEHTAMVFGIDPGGQEQTAFPIATKSGIASEASSLAQVVRTLSTR
ncbi:MAG TPA: SCO family protein [Actinomycetes bacterium]|jgi:cytochrome oxidase Cu insertion factor (SCO1/SenC/PrrC family)|nr:SCO family protein [Actinomycetes bacterium]